MGERVFYAVYVRRLDRAFTELNLELTYAAWLMRALKFNYAAKSFGAA